MKNIYLLGAVGVLIITIIVLSVILSKTDAKRDKLNSELKNKNIEISTLQDFINKLQKAKTQEKEYFILKTDSISKKYKSEISYYKKLWRDALNKSGDTVFVENESDSIFSIKTLSDGFKVDNLSLNYTATYWGGIENIDFTWDIKEKLVEKNHIVYEDKPVNVPTPMAHYLLSYHYGGFYHDFEFAYFSKGAMGIGGGGIYYNGKFHPKFGLSIKLDQLFR